jgi:hypothetical protein
MVTPRYLAFFALSLAFIGAPARAADPRCAAPPFGGSMASYQAFVKYFGKVVIHGKPVVPDKVLADMCNAKFAKIDRAKLYPLGFTDLEFATKDPEVLGAHLITAQLGTTN